LGARVVDHDGDPGCDRLDDFRVFGGWDEVTDNDDVRLFRRGRLNEAGEVGGCVAEVFRCKVLVLRAVQEKNGSTRGPPITITDIPANGDFAAVDAAAGAAVVAVAAATVVADAAVVTLAAVVAGVAVVDELQAASPKRSAAATAARRVDLGVIWAPLGDVTEIIRRVVS
jgi:hypothetical protein